MAHNYWVEKDAADRASHPKRSATLGQCAVFTE
jgi:hypothetical protein